MTETIKGKDGNIEFFCLEPPDLSSVPVAVQALDNQWLPRGLLTQMKMNKQLTRSIEKQREKSVRAEYVRALVNGRQTVINRAYIYNNQAVFQDYLQHGPSREAFKALLNEGVIVPYLYMEKSPVEPATYENAPRGFETWQQLCQEVSMKCIRLSWNNTLNSSLTRDQLALRFHNFCQLTNSGDMDTFMRDLGLDISAKSSLRKRFIEMAQLCLEYVDQEKLMTRNALYKVFVTSGDNPQERVYDVTRPFALEMKQLIDLAYNSYLPDALGGYLLTPVDSLPRTALQEWHQAVNTVDITAEELVRLLQRTAFDLISQGLYLKSMELLSLQDVREIRNMDEWRFYIESLEDLLVDPFQFADGGAAKVYQSYAKLAQRMTQLIKKNEQQMGNMLALWSPIVELVINIAGAVLSITWTEDGSFYQFFGKVSTQLTSVSVPVIGRLVIRNLSKKHEDAELAASIDFLKARMSYPHQQWATIQKLLRNLPSFREVQRAFAQSEFIDATINYQEQALL